ncbi:hypothetical protein FHL15_002598 [Xylaria flabelliformis]|uniref:Uncharacterized protein n=1 Tax=Xylaria flabelliformis TaxID=2512241 RepID=A0A553I7Z8_9PEZI|nr:hypothetical protein FHL15_002598 [Xylaria flabelliformis]
MPISYGEGAKKAFQRLETEILNTSFDQFIFVWRGPYASSGLLANSPSDFASTLTLRLCAPANLAPTTMTNIGFHARLLLCKQPEEGPDYINHPLAAAQTGMPSDANRRLAAIQCDILSNYGGMIAKNLVVLDRGILDECEWEDALVLQDDQYILWKKRGFVLCSVAETNVAIINSF